MKYFCSFTSSDKTTIYFFSSVAEEFLTLRNLNLAYCRKIIHKWHKINTKYNKPFMIKEIIDGSVRPLGWRTFIHRRYDAVHDFCFVWPIHQTISIIFLIENLVGKHDSTYSMYFLAIWKLLSHNLSPVWYYVIRRQPWKILFELKKFLPAHVLFVVIFTWSILPHESEISSIWWEIRYKWTTNQWSLWVKRTGMQRRFGEIGSSSLNPRKINKNCQHFNQITFSCHFMSVFSSLILSLPDFI